MTLNNENFYSHSFKKHGVSAKGVSWNSKYSQEIRFEILTDLLQVELSHSSIVDAGCGFADLPLYWESLGVQPKSYIGIDRFAEFISIAKQRVSKGVFLHKDILKDKLPKAHWYIASGSLNILSDFETWLFLENMLANSQKGIVFNILQGKNPKSSFNYKTKEEMVQFAEQKGLGIQIIEGYLPRDMSIKLTKEVE